LLQHREQPAPRGLRYALRRSSESRRLSVLGAILRSCDIKQGVGAAPQTVARVDRAKFLHLTGWVPSFFISDA